MNSRKTALPVSFVVCLALVTCALAQSKPAPSGQPPPASVPATGGAAASLQAYEGAVAVVRALTRDLEDLVAQMRDLQARRPRPPASNASDDEKRRYEQEMAQWNTQIEQLGRAIDAKVQALDKALARLNAAAAQVSAAKRQDADSVRKAAEKTRATAQSLLAGLRQNKGDAAKRTRTPVGGAQPLPGKTSP
jgi:septal ring factor EnvC (AmiA/AmiB activator)